MPRQGDGSGDSGPYEAHEIVHGNSGDDSLQHTKHVAPAPKLEKGEALPGMNASGGAAAPLNDASEEYGATAPRHERQEDDDTSNPSTTRSSGVAATKASSNTGRTGQTSAQSGNGNFSQNTQGSRSEHDPQDLEQVSREKAERYVNLDEEDVDHAASQNHNVSGAQRSSQRAPRDVGSKEDVEQIHGKAQLNKGDDRSEDTKRDSHHHQHHQHKHEGKGSSDSHGHGRSDDNGGNEYEQEVRHKAEKFVSLDEE